MDAAAAAAAAAVAQAAGRRAAEAPAGACCGRGALTMLGPLAVAVSASACITALTAPVYAPAVAGAVLAGIVTLFVGVWVSTLGRGRSGTVGVINLCFSFLALTVAIAQGGEFDADLLLKIYNAL